MPEPDHPLDAPKTRGPEQKKKDRNLAYAAIGLGVLGALFGWLTLRKKNAAPQGSYTYPSLTGSGQVAGAGAPDPGLLSQLAQALSALEAQNAGISAQLAGIGGNVGAVPAGATANTGTANATELAGLTAQVAGLSAQIGSLAAVPGPYSAPSGSTAAEAAMGATPTQVGAQPPVDLFPQPAPVLASTVPDNWQQNGGFAPAPPGSTASPIITQGQIIGETFTNTANPGTSQQWQTDAGLAPTMPWEQATPITAGGQVIGESFTDTSPAPAPPQLYGPGPQPEPGYYSIYGQVTPEQYAILPAATRLPR